jgi:hypothetical protein
VRVGELKVVPNSCRFLYNISSMMFKLKWEYKAVEVKDEVMMGRQVGARPLHVDIQ